MGIPQDPRSHDETRVPLRLRRAALRAFVGIGLSVAGYLLARRWLGSDLAALAVAQGIPIAWMLVTGLRRGRVDPIAATAAIVLAAALAVAVLSGSGVAALKLRRAVVSGLVGIACLSSVAVGRPLFPEVIALLGRSFPRVHRLRSGLPRATSHRNATAITAVFGVTALCDAAAQATLSFTVSTTTFVAVAGLTRLAVVATGLAVCGIYLRVGARRRVETAGVAAESSAATSPR